MSEIGIELKGVGLRFDGRIDTQAGLRGWLIDRVSGRERKSGFSVQALRQVSLRISQGQRVGLIGLNGAGKSSLLKVMAGIYPPTEGAVVVRGRVCPLFEFATGFEMNQSGWDNIRIRGMLVGMTQEEIEAKMPAIAEFTDLGEFLDYPVRTYSAGMFIRLAFAISTSVDPEILLIDEVMGAGDVRFADKAARRMQSFMEQGKILVFATHNLEHLKTMCERVVWIDRGEVVGDGRASDVVDQYLAFGASGVRTTPSAM